MAQIAMPAIGENSPDPARAPLVKNDPGPLVKSPLVKNQSRADAITSDFSPIHFSPMRLAVAEIRKIGRKGRPRNPELPPSPGPYYYWQKAGGGLKLERRRPYEYIGFIMPQEWEHLRGKYEESYILEIILAAIRVKRAGSASSGRTGEGNT